MNRVEDAATLSETKQQSALRHGHAADAEITPEHSLSLPDLNVDNRWSVMLRLD